MALPPRIPREVGRAVRQPDPRVAIDHRAMIRRLVCVVCGRIPVVGAHLRAGLPDEGKGGMALKPHDKWLIPLCPLCHGEQHNEGESWIAARGIDGRAVAAALWAARGDIDAMERVIGRARLKAMMATRHG